MAFVIFENFPFGIAAQATLAIEERDRLERLGQRQRPVLRRKIRLAFRRASCPSGIKRFAALSGGE
ncbi:hypothetical protein RsS62_45000 [Rhizobium dioscoreae]|uniref:Uncharacterized protein n=1 Tax=Rhizobium dioscoreae TaxID=2653122 RepID=A0ABQ0YYB5_9HYPH|nr:hypothetical protein RsS62_45000 [Rhizobium dioscoreae]GES48266.1 hypothetical protein RsS93_08800 [Rhizobium dioscoreae]GLU79265.1 hypothetical protein Rhsp01_04410 [Rhizobium sp. NBRC 114257]